MIDLVIVGGGPAGLAAAYSAWQHGLRDILILERDNELGGILNQCIHNGFGLHRFGEQLTGPEYAGRCIELLRQPAAPGQKAVGSHAGTGALGHKGCAPNKGAQQQKQRVLGLCVHQPMPSTFSRPYR